MSKLAEITKKQDDGTRTTLSVEQIENGFLIEKRWEGYKGTGEKKEWKYECKKYFSKTDPLDGADKQLADFFD